MSQSKFAVGTEASLPPVVIKQHRPAAVLKASKDIDDFYAAQATPPVETPPTPPVEQPPVETPPATPTPPVETPPVTPQSNTENLPPPSPGDDWEHRYRSANGRLVAALRRADLAEAEVQALTTRMAQLEARVNAAPNLQQQDHGPLPDLTPEEIANLGPEIIEMVNKRAAIIARSETARLQQQIDALTAGVETTARLRGASAQQIMYADLDDAVPNWRVVNNDENFHRWLDGVDAFSGRDRRSMLTEAFNQNASQRVVAFFKTFVNSGVVPSAQGTQPHADGANQPHKVPLEAFAAPGRGASGSAPVETAKPIWSGADITKFYDDVRRGRYAGRDAERVATETDLIMAQAEGRVRQ